MADDDHERAEADVELAGEMHQRWLAGEKKSALEREYWDDGSSHGQAFSAFVREHLGIETVKRSAQAQRLERAESLLRVHGIEFDDEGLAQEYRLLARSREAALTALRVYNDPTAGFRTETFAVMMIVAWNTLFQAVCERDSLDYFEHNPTTGETVTVDGRPKAMATPELASLVIGGDEFAAMRANLDYWLGLRNLVAHRYLPELDALVVPEAQALLLNFEKRLVAEFGDDARLGRRLAVPLHLEGFRSDVHLRSLKQLQAKLPPDVNDYLTRHRQDQPEEIRRDSEYSMRVFLVAVAANRASHADMTATFVKPDEVSDELLAELTNAAVITKERQVEVGTKGLLHPTKVSAEVQERTGLKFNNNRHVRTCKFFDVRPFGDDKGQNPERTDSRYCVHVPYSDDYGYRRAWVEKLVREFGQPGRYEEIVGLPAQQA